MKIYGKPIDQATRCVHYHSPLDVIAIKFKCCDRYYPCHQCHEEVAGHTAETWKRDEWDTTAVLCGICETELTINTYMQSGNHCPHCHTSFNPNCEKHYHYYFEV